MRENMDGKLLHRSTEGLFFLELFPTVLSGHR